MRTPIKGLFQLACLSTSLMAGELAPPTEAKFIRVIVFATSGAKVDCSDRDIQAELPGVGLVNDASAKVAWAGSEKEVSRLAKQGKLVICGNPDWFPDGAGVAITADGGRPTIQLNMKAIGNSGMSLPDTIIKLASKVVR